MITAKTEFISINSKKTVNEMTTAPYNNNNMTSKNNNKSENIKQTRNSDKNLENDFCMVVFFRQFDQRQD